MHFYPFSVLVWYFLDCMWFVLEIEMGNNNEPKHKSSHLSYLKQLTHSHSHTFYLGNCPYCSRRGFHLFSYFTFISGEQTVLFDPRRRMVLAGILSCVHGHRQSGTFKRLMLTFHIVYLFKHVSIYSFSCQKVSNS